MVTVQEYDKMSAAERQQTIDNLMGSDPQNAQILMIREQELQGQNTANPTVKTQAQAAEIREAQAYNQQVYQAKQAEKQETQIVNTYESGPSSAPVSEGKNPFLPPEPGTASYGVQGNYVVKGATIYDKSGAEVGVVGDKSKPFALREGEVYDVVLPSSPVQPQKVKQSDLGVANQFLIGLDALYKVAPSLIEQKFGKDTPLSKVAKLEFETAGKFGLDFAAGEVAAIESNVYGFASLAGSTKRSIEKGELTFASGFEGFNEAWKTPALAPSSISSATGVLFGDSSEGRAFESQSLGYRLGNALAEAGIFVTTGEVTGYALSKTGSAIKSVVQLNPKVNAVVESAALRSKVAMSNVPKLKYGKVEVPFESGEKAVWKGLYLERGSNAKLLTGEVKAPSSGVIKSHGVTGEGVGFVPVSKVDASVTLKTMEKVGYPSEVLQDVKDIRGLMGKTQYSKPKNIESLLPVETQTLSQKGVSTVKEFVIGNKKDVERLYGSFTQKPQLAKDFEYAIRTPDKQVVSALRTPADIDIQLNLKGVDAENFAQRLTKNLQGVGEKVRVSAEKPTLIESLSPEGNWRHAVDIHASGDLVDAVPAKAWGFNVKQAPIKIEKITTQRLSEQGLAKGVSVLGFKEDLKVGPVAHRSKDIPDFLQAQRSLFGKDDSRIVRLAERFGVKDLSKASFGEEFTVKTPVIGSGASSKLLSGVSRVVVPSGSLLSGSKVSKVVSKSSSGVSGSKAVSKLITSNKDSPVISKNIDLGIPSYRLPSFKSPNFGGGGFPVYPSKVPSSKRPEPSIGGYPVYPSKTPSSKSPDVYGPSYPIYPSKTMQPDSYFSPSRSYPKYDMGGGGFGSGRSKGFKGKWKKINNPIKSPEKVLASIGIKTPKNLKIGLGVIDKSLKRIDKSVDKSLKRSSTKGKSKGRSKRKR